MELNQRLFDGTELRASVRDKLLQDANKFIDFLHDPDINVQDIIFTGSNASYNFTPTSDVDVHILADFTTLPFSSIADSYFLAEKALFKQTYDITIYGYPVEMYVQDTASHDSLKANGIYSLRTDQWVKFPADVPTIDHNAVAAKSADYEQQINTLLNGPHSIQDIDALSARIRDLRTAGLETQLGEFSVENLVFKQLRADGYFDQLNAEKRRLADLELSLESRSAKVLKLARSWG